jgi:homoserine dehydrogenase
LVAVANRTEEGLLDLRVHPALVPHTHPLSKVDNAFNAVLIEATPLGQIMFYGPGAGAGPTASAIVADLINILSVPKSPMDGGFTETYPLLPLDEVTTRFYCRLKAKDHPGVIGHLGQAFVDTSVLTSQFKFRTLARICACARKYRQGNLIYSFQNLMLFLDLA